MIRDSYGIFGMLFASTDKVDLYDVCESRLHVFTLLYNFFSAY